MSLLFTDVLKIFFGAALSVSTAYILLRVENRKQIMAKSHEFAIKELGEKVFSPLLNELASYETKKTLGRSHDLNLETIILAISKNQFQLLFTTDKINHIINSIYIYSTSTTNTDSTNLKTQDQLILDSIQELKTELQSAYSKYRM